jgi:excisionase family DNA binding protein
MTTSDARAQLLVLYTIPEAAAILRVPEGWLRKKVTAGVVPHSRLGKHVRFSDENLRQIVDNGSVETALTAPLPSGLSPRARRTATTLPGAASIDR